MHNAEPGLDSPPVLDTCAEGFLSIIRLILPMDRYPLDTIKTRMQAKQGFRSAGGFSGVYKGLSAAAAASAPCGGSPVVVLGRKRARVCSPRLYCTAAVFFGTYEKTKTIAAGFVPSDKAWAGHMLAASTGETVSQWSPAPSRLAPWARWCRIPAVAAAEAGPFGD